MGGKICRPRRSSRWIRVSATLSLAHTPASPNEQISRLSWRRRPGLSERRANAKLLEKVVARQAELEAELEMLAQYGKAETIATDGACYRRHVRELDGCL